MQHNAPANNVYALPQQRGSVVLTDTALEAHVLGAVLADSELWRDVLVLDESHFSDKNNADLWRLIADLRAQNKPVSPSVLPIFYPEETQRLGGRDLLDALAVMGAEIAPAIQDAVDRLIKLAKWRTLNTINSKLNEALVSGGGVDPDEMLSFLHSESHQAICNGAGTSETKKSVAKRALNAALEPYDPVFTGIAALDFVIGQLMPRRMIGIGANTGRGKTILLGTISENLNTAGVRHMFLSLETPPEDIEIRNCARRMELNASHIYDQTHKMHARFVDNAEAWIEAMPDNTLYEYRPRASIEQIERIILRAVHRDGVKGVIVDYWQLIRGKGKGIGRDEHLNDCADRLAALARNEGIWIILTAQTDEYGKPVAAIGIQYSSSIYVVLQREENDDVAHFVAHKSNYTRTSETGKAAQPGLIFDLVGPHFRDARPEDIISHIDEDGDADLRH